LKSTLEIFLAWRVACAILFILRPVGRSIFDNRWRLQLIFLKEDLRVVFPEISVLVATLCRAHNKLFVCCGDRVTHALLFLNRAPDVM